MAVERDAQVIRPKRSVLRLVVRIFGVTLFWVDQVQIAQIDSSVGVIRRRVRDLPYDATMVVCNVVPVRLVVFSEQEIGLGLTALLDWVGMLVGEGS